METTYVFRFLDGPHPADVIVDEQQFPWPPPGIINGGIPGGYYVKVREDERPARISQRESIRFAEYRWQTSQGKEPADG